MNAFVCPRRVRQPALRLVAFHHAGGSAAAYCPLARHLPPDWEVLLHDLPGHGSRRAEPPGREMDRVIDGAAAQVAAQMSGPYALFGHSMGAIVAVEVGRRLAATGRPPVWVGVSGRAAPSEPGVGDGVLLSQLDDGDLFAALLQLGGIPARLDEIPELKELFLRTVRADLTAVDSYRPWPGRQPLPCPVTAFGGITDPWAPPGSLSAWQHETTRRVRQCLFPGGHFYFQDAGFGALAREIRTEVRVALTGPHETREMFTVGHDGFTGSGT